MNPGGEREVKGERVGEREREREGGEGKRGEGESHELQQYARPPPI